MNPFNMELIKNLEKRKIVKYSPLKIIMEYSPLRILKIPMEYSPLKILMCISTHKKSCNILSEKHFQHAVSSFNAKKTKGGGIKTRPL